MPSTPSPFPFVSPSAHTPPFTKGKLKYPTTTSLSIFPLEIWLGIFDVACTDDGTTSLSLSRTSRAFRELSRFHRYRSVVLEGWESVVKFEQVYCSGSNLNTSVKRDGAGGANVGDKVKGKMKMKDEVEVGEAGEVDEDDYLLGATPISGIVNLYVHIPELYNAAYPPETWLPDIDSDEDSTYSPDTSDDEGDGGRNEQAQGTSKETNTEPTDLVQHARNDDDGDETSSTSTDGYLSDASAPEEPPARPREPRPMHGQNLSHLLEDPLNLLALFEHKVYSALRRILLLSSSSLQVFALSLHPVSSFHLEAVIPRLGNLRWFSVFKDTMEDNSSADIPRTLLSFRLKLTRVEKLSQARGCLWPNLECLDVNSRDNAFDMTVRNRDRRAWNEDAFEGLLAGATKLKVVYAPRYMVRPLSPFPQSVQSIHAYLGTPSTYSHISIPINSFTPTPLGPVPAGPTTLSLSLPVFFPGQSTNANASSSTTNTINSDNNTGTGTVEDTATDKSKRGAENEQKVQLALSEGEIMSLLYRGVPQSVVQQVRSNTAAVYYRVPEPVEMESAGRDDVDGGDTIQVHEDADENEDENERGEGEGKEGEGGGTESETENQKDRGKGKANGMDRGAKSTSEPAWVKERWLKAVERGW
ncbi:hypothetical protein MD484_g8826, partial [Candolleomyces efflorescens]